MARIRTIKPSFFTSLTITDLTYEQRLTFIGLWTHVDDEGRCEYDARLLKAAVWPLDERSAADVESDVNALTEAGLVTRYIVASRAYLSVNGWYEHQRINRPRESEYPAPDEGQTVPLTCTNSQFTEPSVKTHGSITESSLPERKGKEGNREGKGKDSRAPRSETDTTPDQFDIFWDTYDHKVGRKKAITAYRAAIKKVDSGTLIAAAEQYIAWQKSEGKHPTYTKHPATWLHGEHWNDERAARQKPQTRIQEHAALVEKLRTEEQGTARTEIEA